MKNNKNDATAAAATVCLLASVHVTQGGFWIIVEPRA